MREAPRLGLFKKIQDFGGNNPMSKCCKGICEKYPRLPHNYYDGKKSCRECGFFLDTQEVFCPCCKYPLASKGRANRTQLNRRLENSHVLTGKILHQTILGPNSNQRRHIS